MHEIVGHVLQMLVCGAVVCEAPWQRMYNLRSRFAKLIKTVHQHVFYFYTPWTKAVVHCENVVSRKEVGTRPWLRCVTYLWERQRIQLRLNAPELWPTQNHRAGKLTLNHRHCFAVSVQWYVSLHADCVRRKVAEPQWNRAESQLCFIRVTWSALPGWCTAAQLESTACGGGLDADTDSTLATWKGIKRLETV